MHMPSSDHAVLLKATALHGRLSTAMLCCDLEKNGMVRAWHGCGMASVNQTRPHCVNQMGKTHSKHLGARHGRGTAWARHVMCESAFFLLLPSALLLKGYLSLLVLMLPAILYDLIWTNYTFLSTLASVSGKKKMQRKSFKAHWKTLVSVTCEEH